MATFNKIIKKPITYTKTHEGGAAFKIDPLADLVFTAACTFVGQDTFYESADARLDRIIELTHLATAKDPGAVVGLIRELRLDFKIRAVSIVVAAEYVRSVENSYRVREAVNNACQRADEPAEFLAYWLNNVGRAIPRGVKLGLGDAVRRLYNEKSAMKYDSKDRTVRMADVIELCHVKPETPAQSTLYHYMLDLRHRSNDAWDLDGWDGRRDRSRVSIDAWDFDPDHLLAFQNRKALMDLPKEDRRTALRTWGYTFFEASGFTWEMLSSWLPGGMDGEAWSFIIPRMGVMALIRNLRNFDKAGLPDSLVDQVIAKITNEEDVRKSRIFPYHVMSAYEAAPSDNWLRALGKTVELAYGNVLTMDRTLFLIDTSGSMQQALSSRSTMQRVQVAALQAVTAAKRSKTSDIAIYGQTSMVLSPEWRQASILRATAAITSSVGVVGHSTFGYTAIANLFDPSRHSRVIIFTDDQQYDSGMVDVSHVPELITFNVGGYAAKSTWGRHGAHTNIQVAGFSDQIFNSLSKILGIINR